MKIPRRYDDPAQSSTTKTADGELQTRISPNDSESIFSPQDRNLMMLMWMLSCTDAEEWSMPPLTRRIDRY